MPISEPPITRLAKGYGGAHQRKVWAYVVHDEEFPERLDSAERVADYFATGPGNGSAHYCGDPNSETHCVPESRQAYGVGGCNDGTIHFEQDGYAKQTRAEWLDTHSRATIARCAARAAAVCIKYDLPAIKRSTADGERRTPGIYGHVDLSRVSWVPSTHTDPGSYYPWDVFMSDVRRAIVWLVDDSAIRTFQKLRGLEADGYAGIKTILALGTWLNLPYKPPAPPPPVAPPTLRKSTMEFTVPALDMGNSAHADDKLPGSYVRMAQACLMSRGYLEKGASDRTKLEALDGIPGPKTRAALAAFQTAHKLPATGKYDANTYRLLTGAS